MSSLQSIFILGATGYIGGTLLVPLLTEYPSATIVVLVRKPEAGVIVKELAPSRITIVQGSHSNLELIQAEAAKADLVINTADCDDVALTKSIIKGLGDRENKGILIHTSGSAVIFDGDLNGVLSSRGQKVWDDTNLEDMHAIPVAAPHRPVDLEIINSHNEGAVDGHIVCPTLVYGVGTGPVNKRSIQIPKLVEIALRWRAVVHVGEGTNIWGNIHINDLIQLYLAVIKNAIFEHQKATHNDGYQNYFFASSGENSIRSITELIAPLLYKKGFVDSPHAQSVTQEEEPVLAMYLGHTSRALPKRAEGLGWSAKEVNLEQSIEKDLEVILESFGK